MLVGGITWPHAKVRIFGEEEDEEHEGDDDDDDDDDDNKVVAAPVALSVLDDALVLPMSCWWMWSKGCMVPPSNTTACASSKMF